MKSRLTIKEIQVWSVARTMFPLAWILNAVVFFCMYLLVGSLIASLSEGLPGLSIIEPGAGIWVGLLFSVLMGFFGAVVITLLAVLAVGIYNLLGSLGGGFSIRLSDPEAPSRPPDSDPGTAPVDNQQHGEESGPGVNLKG